MNLSKQNLDLAIEGSLLNSSSAEGTTNKKEFVPNLNDVVFSNEIDYMNMNY